MNWIDTYLGNYFWYRKRSNKKWYKHQFTRDAQEICGTFQGTFWTTYGNINRYSKVI
jgi:hypothetical protein